MVAAGESAVVERGACSSEGGGRCGRSVSPGRSWERVCGRTHEVLREATELARLQEGVGERDMRAGDVNTRATAKGEARERGGRTWARPGSVEAGASSLSVMVASPAGLRPLRKSEGGWLSTGRGEDEGEGERCGSGWSESMSRAGEGMALSVCRARRPSWLRGARWGFEASRGTQTATTSGSRPRGAGREGLAGEWAVECSTVTVDRTSPWLARAEGSSAPPPARSSASSWQARVRLSRPHPQRPCCSTSTCAP